MKKFLQFVSYVLVAALASFGTLMFSAMNPPAPEAPSKLVELADLIGDRFIGEYDPVEMEDAAARAMIASLGDRWSYYISAAEYDAYLQSMKNTYVGVGITITVREDQKGFDIVQVAEGGSAAEVGILPGDILIGADGQTFEGMTTTEASVIVRGEAGSTVELTVLRGEEELTFTPIRRVIRTIVAKGQMLPGDIGLVTIENFEGRCAEEAIAAIDALVAQGAKALIFDVRNNPGGYVSELCKVLDHLLPEGDLFHSEYFDGTESKETSNAKCIDLPLAVLVNGDSYSAAEFFAAAIREYEAGFVVGTQTCGKGYFQTVMELRDGSAVGLSIGKYYTPKGVSLAEAGGLIPDVVVEVDEQTYAAIAADLLTPEQDPQLQAAMEKLNQE